MTSELAPYKHAPVVGLPRSLLQHDGNSTVVVMLMQNEAGLNRGRRRALKEKYKTPSTLKALGDKISKTDRSILPILLNPSHRFSSFWTVVRVMESQQSSSCSTAYAAAVDVQLLKAYEPKWIGLLLDEDALITVCPEWPIIRRDLETHWQDPKGKMPLGMFMLWPRLLSDLKRWENLETQQRLEVGHVIFALSSIGRTYWFIDEALRRCPDLESDFGDLLRLDALDERIEETPSEVDSGIVALAPAVTAASASAEVSPLPDVPEPPPIDLTLSWTTIGHKLTELQAEWFEVPSRALAAKLASLGNQAAELIALIPDDAVPPRELLEQGLETLHIRLMEAAGSGDLGWLGPDDLSGITARWNIALDEAADDEAVTELVQDVALALDRVADAIGEVQSAKQLADEAHQAIIQLDDQLAQQSSAIRRIEVSRRRQLAREDELSAESKLMDAMLFALASASPKGEAFDPEANYPAQLASRGEITRTENGSAVEVLSYEFSETEVETHALAPEQAGTLVSADATVEATAALDEEPQVPEPTESPQVSGPIVDAFGPEVATSANSACVSSPESLAGHLKPPQEVTESSFNNEAGDQCRPIWTLLGHGRPVLAYHYAKALQEAFPELRSPPPALLRAVALAKGLANSDGPLALAIGECFGDIEPSWFESDDSPSSWHTALNLLLIAATLRPMILSPGTGAAAIARCRHLDGRYDALLQLVRKVGEVSDLMPGVPIGVTILQSAVDDATQRTRLNGLSRNAEEWLTERAPSKKIRYAPASKVWMTWLKPGEMIHRLLTPVVCGAVSDRAKVKAAIDELSSYDFFLECLHETDRQQRGRRGQDIEAGALEHLWTATSEAVAIAKGWLAAADLLSDSRGRLRELVGRLQAAFDVHAKAACKELSTRYETDEWSLIEAASFVLHEEVRAIASMFSHSEVYIVAEPQPGELLARDLFCVPGLSIGPGWVIETGGPDLLSALKAWAHAPVDTATAFDTRLQTGDLTGAELLVPRLVGKADERGLLQALERARDHWAKDIQNLVLRARRASEVGLAYGYLTDAERAECESELSVVELSQRETTRFDAAERRVRAVIERIESQKSKRLEAARRDLEIERQGLADEVAQLLESPLALSDIHTFNELLQRVRQGLEPWPERDRRRDVFKEFYPELATDLQGQLQRLAPETVLRRIRSGEFVGRLSFDLDGEDQSRADAQQIYTTWATAASKRSLSRDGLRKILEALGVPVSSIEQDRAGKDSWLLETTTIDDRDVCPVPHFGSRAMGKYRVLVIKERPEDLLQVVGYNTQHTATVVLSLPPIRTSFLADLARQSKERQQSFLLLDQTMLLFLLAQRAGRLATWFGISLPFTYSEPYDASAGFVPGEMFYGRLSELESVKAQGGCYFIYGGRQLGKTALLRRAERTFHDPSSGRYAVWMDTLAQGIGERRPAIDVWVAISEKLRELKISGLDIPSVNPAKGSTIDAFLMAIKAFLKAKTGRRILLLLDETDHFFEHDARQASPYAETRRLKQLMDETERRFKVVFAGLHNVLRTASTSNQPLGHLNEAVRIGPLMNEREIRAAEELITRPIEAAGFEFEDRSLVMRVLAQTNYYPSLIQLYCTQVLRHLRESRLRKQSVSGPRFRIDESDIETVFSGRPLRDAIRSKFRLTLQLDDRYEVIANALGLEALGSSFDHNQGVEWRRLWEDCRTVWWPEGFAKTTERDFLVLLEEMVHLGVLSQAKTPERFSLRNPNVLLLLGSQQEMEDILQTEREPRVAFESTIFRPALAGRVDDPARSPLTYRQLDEVMQLRSSVLLVAASEGAGGANLVSSLRDQPGISERRTFVALDRSSDRKAFTQELDREVQRRVAEGLTLMLVPASIPWDSEWVAVARAKLSALTSKTKFVSVVFAADPRRLWELTSAPPSSRPWEDPWLTVLPWDREFVRKWLEELQFPLEAVGRLDSLTGFWGGLLAGAARVKGGVLDFAANLDRMENLLNDAPWNTETLHRLTAGIEEAERVLGTLSSLGDSVDEIDLVDVGELPQELVDRTLRWAEPLGIAKREARGWTLDPFVKRLLKGAGR